MARSAACRGRVGGLKAVAAGAVGGQGASGRASGRWARLQGGYGAERLQRTGGEGERGRTRSGWARSVGARAAVGDGLDDGGRRTEDGGQERNATCNANGAAADEQTYRRVGVTGRDGVGVWQRRQACRHRASVAGDAGLTMEDVS